MQKLVLLLKQLTKNTKIIKGILAVGVLTASFATTSYFIARHVAAQEEQRQDDNINDTVGTNVIKIMDPLQKKGGGTGFFVKTPNDNTFILTNNHVCGLADAAGNLLIDDEYFAQVIAHSPDHDLCLVSNPLNWEGIEVAETSRDGLDVYVVGHPLLEPTALIKGQISGTETITILIGYNLPCNGANEHLVDLGDNLFAAMAGIVSACIRDYESQATTLNILPGNSL